MNFLFVYTLATLFSVVFAQRAAIGFPNDGTSVTAGSKLLVEIDRGNSLSASQEVAIVIGLQSCPSSACAAPSDIMGSILYNGPFAPKLQANATFKPPHQNFTVTIPSTIAKGKAQLGVVHVSLIGAGQAPFLETFNITLNVV
ncbi:hypothetical protein BDQ12DRAFT_690313 [Crucibulum laeve]|uniref:Phosphatidylglycerol/phosphatidylinositol transfer protein n=1 Tax=Crucibulum laeve TaxID=68775 RepID=A0A5C3LLQ7_9AGAR|nr:hypothetical protein BDQ12DRAFT_690313 [Crucibulum laeve]